MGNAGRRPGSHTQTVRALKLFVALQRKPVGYQLEDLAREHEVSERTIRRDVDALVEAGFDIDVSSSQVRLRKAPTW